MVKHAAGDDDPLTHLAGRTALITQDLGLRVLVAGFEDESEDRSELLELGRCQAAVVLVGLQARIAHGPTIDSK